MKKIMFIIFIIVILCSKNLKDTKIIIPKESIRLRILANSNTNYDQRVKEKVSSNLQLQTYNTLKDVENIETARIEINNNMLKFKNNIEKTLEEEKYKLNYNIDYGLHYFPAKEYKGVVYEEGEYESLLVTLGKGEGNNWWCVLFPPLCLIEAEESNIEEVEYKSFIFEIISKIFK